jgi:type-2 restriction enzyme apaLI
MNRQQREFYRIFSQHGTGDAQVVVSPKEIVLMTVISLDDLGLSVGCTLCNTEQYLEIARKGFYNIHPDDIVSLPDITEDDCFALLEFFGVTDVNNVLFLYLKNLCDLYRRRVKYDNILRSQQFPVSDQISPRSILEYGNCDDKLLADWLQWRKLIFDLDNRSAQETGYVFEPILASCLGGESVSAKHSPVKRIDDAGITTEYGRQIDCYIPSSKEAFELKMRVTIAASGQGRLNEEMSFPYEARQAGIVPVLVVFDATPSPLLTRLCDKYIECGGKCFIGDAAWRMLEEHAGKEMGLFISKYVYPPIAAMNENIHAVPGSISLSEENQCLVISNNRSRYSIRRDKFC